MRDTETFFGKSEQLHPPSTLLRDQKSDALWNLAFWSNPAWIRSADDSLCSIAVTQWVVYHRTTITLTDLIPVAQVIGSVRGVIPDSKLAKYGDYSYDIDYEDMCYITEDANTRCHVAQTSQAVGAGRRNIWAMDAFDTKTDNPPRESDSRPTTGNESALSGPHETRRCLDEWLEKLKRALESVRQIAHEAELLDPWTDTLLKISLRLICVARINYALVELLNKDVTFINNYEELQKTPISEIELQSIPQPERDCGLDRKLTDALWVKLSSPEIRKFWKDDAKNPFPFNTKSHYGRHLLPLMKINFLRNSRPKMFDSSEHTVEIPKNMEVELLGSFLQVINEAPTMQSGSASSAAESVQRNHFPEAHGDWTKALFPRRVESGRPFERECGFRRPSIAAQFPDSATKAEHCSVETRMMPLRFYMSVPPPPLASAAVCIPPSSTRPLSYAYCHPRNGVLYVPTNNMTASSLPQQVQLKVPPGQMTCIPPTMFASTPALSTNCSVPQRLSAPRQTLVAGQYPRMNESRGIYQQPHSKEDAEVQKCQTKVDEPIFNQVRDVPQQNENIAKEDEHSYESGEVKISRGNPWLISKTFAQRNQECNPPMILQQSGGNTVRSRSILPPIAKRTTPSNTCGFKSNSQLLTREPRMQTTVNYPIASYRLPPPVIPQACPPRNHCIQPQFNFKPRFLGAITIHDLKRLQERSLYLKYKSGEMHHQDAQRSVSIENLPLNRKDTSVGYEDKVEQWLETVNEYVRSGSFINIEELPEPPRREVTGDHSNLDACGKGDGVELEEWCSKNTAPDFRSKRIYGKIKVPFNCMGGKYHENGVDTPTKHKNKNSRKILLKQLLLLRNYLLKLKKGRGLGSKIMLAEKFFAELNFNEGDLFRLKHAIRSLKWKKLSRYLLKPEKRQEFDLKKGNSFGVGMKSNSKPLHSESYFDVQKDKIDDLLTNDAFDFKIRVRESHEFNTFPSKRMKACNSISLFSDKDVWVRDELTRKICSLNYFDAAIDELFFGQRKEPDEEISDKSACPEVVNGWTHLKIAIKTVMTNLISSLETSTIK